VKTALSAVVGLGDERDSMRLGAILARSLHKVAPVLTICLRGGLGSGKTTLVRGLVAALPGGGEAEVSSPSFNIVNIYPTRPEVIHMDLYRLEGMVSDDLFEDAVPGPHTGAPRLVVIEWSEFLPEGLVPEDRLTLSWLPCETGRLVRIEASGVDSERLFQAISPLLGEFAADSQERTPAKQRWHGRGTKRPSSPEVGGAMRILVQKYGGTSVANLKCMKQVLAKIKNNLAAGYKIVVALSAMSGETNRLLQMASKWSANPDPAECDSLVSTGEQVSVALFAMLLKDEGIRARSLLGFQIPIHTNCNYGRARIMDIDSAKLEALLEENDVLVVAGFQGVDETGRITTLGRGGSDTTGVALAAALQAEVCEIYTDVKGVYTTDPNMCSTARKMERITYDEMLEFSSMGAKVLQIRSVEFAKKFNVPVRVRSTFCDDPGTLVTQEDENMEDVLVSGIAYDRDQCRITVWNVVDRPGVAASIFSPIAEAGILVDMIVQNTSREGRTDMTFTVPRSNLDKTLNILEAVKQEIGTESIQHDLNVCKVSVIGVGMRSHSGVAAKMFTTLHNDRVNILMIATSEIKITCLIEEKYLELAVRALHDAFELEKERQAQVCAS
jgi:aspartate kinase